MQNHPIGLLYTTVQQRQFFPSFKRLSSQNCTINAQHFFFPVRYFVICTPRLQYVLPTFEVNVPPAYTHYFNPHRAVDRPSNSDSIWCSFVLSFSVSPFLQLDGGYSSSCIYFAFALRLIPPLKYYNIERRSVHNRDFIMIASVFVFVFFKGVFFRLWETGPHGKKILPFLWGDSAFFININLCLFYSLWLHLTTPHICV